MGNKLTRRGEIGKHQRLRRSFQHGGFNRADEQRGRGPSGHDDHSIACVYWRARCRKPDDSLAKQLKIGNSDEASYPRSWCSIHWLQATSRDRRVARLLLQPRWSQKIREVLLHACQHHERTGSR